MTQDERHDQIPMHLSDIVEVIEAGGHEQANPMLRAGYRLLHVESKAVARGRGDGQHYIMRRATFILGRPASVEHVDMPPYRNDPRPEGER